MLCSICCGNNMDHSRPPRHSCRLSCWNWICWAKPLESSYYRPHCHLVSSCHCKSTFFCTQPFHSTTDGGSPLWTHTRVNRVVLWPAAQNGRFNPNHCGQSPRSIRGQCLPVAPLTCSRGSLLGSRHVSSCMAPGNLTQNRIQLQNWHKCSLLTNRWASAMGLLYNGAFVFSQDRIVVWLAEDQCEIWN